MGLLYDVCKSKKYCKMCGCNMLPESTSDYCDCCLDELYESDPGEDEEVIND